jgi:transglutaminase-like putative cysteine protease
VTCSASEALAAGTGYCFAKSHLLAAVLRANGIPAALCYQRLALDESAEESQRRFSLHGLNAVYR